MQSRAKLTVTEVTNIHTADWEGADRKQRVKFQAVYDESIPEDRKFNAATATESSMELVITNQNLIDGFELGAKYYVDLTPIKEDAGEAA